MHRPVAAHVVAAELHGQLNPVRIEPGDAVGRHEQAARAGQFRHPVGRTDALAEIYTWGHRNAQGMAVHPVTGEVWQNEHGPQGGDELNLILPGRNYGWPVIHHDMTKAGMVSPIIQFTPATAAGGAAFYTGNLFPSWKGNFFVANLRSQSLQRIVLNGRRVAGVENLLQNKYGRLRTVAEDRNGYLYVSTSNGDGYGSGQPGQDTILRLSPVR